MITITEKRACPCALPVPPHQRYVRIYRGRRRHSLSMVHGPMVSSSVAVWGWQRALRRAARMVAAHDRRVTTPDVEVPSP